MAKYFMVEFNGTDKRLIKARGPVAAKLYAVDGVVTVRAASHQELVDALQAGVQPEDATQIDATGEAA